MLLIATDEAGYGPKLGPLVVVATTWRLPDAVGTRPTQETLDETFAPVREPSECGGARIIVDDSKSVYQSKGKQGLSSLHAAVSAARNWVSASCSGGTPDRPGECRLPEWISKIATDDCDAIAMAPWLNQLSDLPFLSADMTRPTIGQWSGTGIQLVSIQAKILTARVFNDACDSGMNKADLLSQSTLGLVRRSLELATGLSQQVEIFCDRHGGRRFYAGVLQHTFHESLIQVIAESKRQSEYEFPFGDASATMRFTVKGDSFTPVAMSSIIAKYLRERFMESLNTYFADHHPNESALKPTAGYPVDADRYLHDIAPVIEKLGIEMLDLVRQR